MAKIAYFGTVVMLVAASGRIGLTAPEDGSAAGTHRAPATVKVLPVLEFQGDGQKVVSIDFTNTTRDPIKYMLYNPLRPNYLPIYFLNFELIKDGVVIRPLETPEGPPLAVDMVRTIQPSETVTSELDLRETYGDLKPGRYLLRYKYNIRPGSTLDKEYGLTPMQISSDLMIINIK
jgi:hypothetical protein